MSSRIKNSFLLFLCFLYSLVRKQANQCPQPPSSVLVFPVGKLGDVVCTTPVLHALKQHNKKIEVCVADPTGLNQEILKHSGLVDRFIRTDSTWESIKKIRRVGFGACVITGPDFYPGALAYLSGVPCIVMPKVSGGYSPYETRSLKTLRRKSASVPFQMGEYAPRERLKVLEPLGIYEDDTKKILGYSNPAKEKIKQFLKDQGIGEDDFLVGISPSAGNKIKEWPTERFAEVADHIQQNKKGKVVIIGGPNDYELAEKMKKSMKTGVIDTTGMWNIDELKAFIAHLDLFISVDTGPIYIAEAFEVSTVDITGPIDESEQPPIGELHKVVVPPEREKPELYVLNARVYNKEEARRQTESITPEMVIMEINKIIETK